MKLDWKPSETKAADLSISLSSKPVSHTKHLCFFAQVYCAFISHSPGFLIVTVLNKAKTHNYRPVSSSQFNYLWPFRWWETEAERVLLESGTRKPSRMNISRSPCSYRYKVLFYCLYMSKSLLKCCLSSKGLPWPHYLNSLQTPTLLRPFPLALLSLTCLPRIYHYLNFIMDCLFIVCLPHKRVSFMQARTLYCSLPHPISSKKNLGTWLALNYLSNKSMNGRILCKTKLIKK